MDDLAAILDYYQLWLHELFPKARFGDALAMVAKVGHKRAVRDARRAWLEGARFPDASPGRADVADGADGADEADAAADVPADFDEFDYLDPPAPRAAPQAAPERLFAADEEEDLAVLAAMDDDIPW